MSHPERPYDRLGQLLVDLANELRPLVGQLLVAAAADARADDSHRLPVADADPWLTTAEVARRVGVHRRTIYRALAAGALHGGQLESGGGACRWRIHATEADRWAGARDERFVAPMSRPNAPRTDLARTNQPDSYRARVKEPRS